MRRELAVPIFFATLVAACAGSYRAASPSAPAATPSAHAPDLSPGRLVHVDDVVIGDDHLTVTLPFIGGPTDDPTSPCAMEYEAEANSTEPDVLAVAVIERPSRLAEPLPANGACDSMGHFHEISVRLDDPFLGSKVMDRAGYVFFVSPPDGLVEVTSIPEGWSLSAQEDLPESPTGRWQRSWSPQAMLPQQSQPGRFDLIQSFGGPVNVTGGDVAGSIEVNGTAANLWTSARVGELVMSWRLDDYGLALVANVADFSIDQLVALAESVHLPD